MGTSFLTCFINITTKTNISLSKKVLLSPTRNYTIHGRIVDSFTNLPISNVKLTLLSADSTVIDTCRTFIWNDKAVHPDSYFYMQKNLSEGKYIFKIEHPDYFTTLSTKNCYSKVEIQALTCKTFPSREKEWKIKSIC